MNVSAATLSDDSRAARRTNWTNTSAPRNQPRSSKPGTPGPVATKRSRSSGFKPSMLAGGFKRRMLNRRATTAVASADAAMAVKEPRSCQNADSNSSAIQIVADAVNHVVTGWRRTTLKPHPIMMIATANVTRLNQRAQSSMLIGPFLKIEVSSRLAVPAAGAERQVAEPGSPVTDGGPRFTTGVALRLARAQRAISSFRANHTSGFDRA